MVFVFVNKLLKILSVLYSYCSCSYVIIVKCLLNVLIAISIITFIEIASIMV